MRGEPNKRWNKRITKPCPVCGGRVIVANRSWSWWIRCEDDPFHIKYKSYGDPYSAIRAFNSQINADRIRAMTDEELAEFFVAIQNDVADYYDGGHAFEPDFPTHKDAWLGWLKAEYGCE